MEGEASISMDCNPQMPGRIDISKWVINYIAVAIEGLWVGWPPRALGLLLILIAKLEPEALLRAERVLAVQFGHKPRLVEVHRQRRKLRRGIHTQRGRAAARARS